jgi:hypothetical protein
MYTFNAYEYPAAERIVVIGDLHGDIKRLKTILIDAEVINDSLEWVANPPHTMVVQIGDQVDSANRDPNFKDWEVLDDVQMIHFTNSLDNIAKTKGGRFISLIGNHELMNVIGNFSYVSAKSNDEHRYRNFMPKGTLSPIIGNRQLVLKIGQLFFCHAGIKKQHLDVLDASNKSISYLNDIWKQFVLTNQINHEDKNIFDTVILGMDGILWTRNIDEIGEFNHVLERLSCSYVFVGHTPVNTIQLMHDRMWYTDTGISRAFGNLSYQYINIHNNNISIKEIKDI